MKIAAFLAESYQDYEKGLSSVIFTAGCNYKCPTCHGKEIIEANSLLDSNKVLEKLEKKKDYVNKVVISGGEPTTQLGLVPFLRELKQREFDVKLDTNGSSFGKLQYLLQEELVNYIALDIKGPLNLYAQLIGNEHFDRRDGIEKAIAITSQFPDYEFRTTVVPILNGTGIKWVSVEDYENMAKWVAEIAPNDSKYYLQKFVTRGGDEILDERFAKENLAKEFHETPDKLMNEIQGVFKKYLPKCEIR